MARPTRVLTPSDAAYAGQRHYTPAFLRIYDRLVLGLFSRVWRCPTSRLLAHYQRSLRPRHLDVGPGTGYFLDHVRLPPRTALTVLDPNPNVLAHVARRLADHDVDVVEADVLQPLGDLGPFDSAAMSYVLHCLPGPTSRKAPAVANVAEVLAPDGVLFGATVLGTPHLHTALSRPPLWWNNRKGIFDNLSDTEESLREVLAASFEAVDIEVVGSVAVFTAETPRASTHADSAVPRTR